MAAVSPIVRPIAATILATFGITPAVWIVTATAMLVGSVRNYTKGPQHHTAILVAVRNHYHNLVTLIHGPGLSRES